MTTDFDQTVCCTVSKNSDLLKPLDSTVGIQLKFNLHYWLQAELMSQKWTRYPNSAQALGQFNMQYFCIQMWTFFTANVSNNIQTQRNIISYDLTQGNGAFDSVTCCSNLQGNIRYVREWGRENVSAWVMSGGFLQMKTLWKLPWSRAASSLLLSLCWLRKPWFKFSAQSLQTDEHWWHRFDINEIKMAT